MRVEAELLDVAEDEEGVLNHTILDNLLHIMILDQVLIDQFLRG